MTKQKLSFFKKVSAAAEAKKELDFAAAFIVTDLSYPNRIGIDAVGMHDLTQDEQLGLTVGWNYSHGICSILTGISQLRDKNNYRTQSTKFQGMLNILSGVQLLALSDNFGLFGIGSIAGATPLAAPAMAFTYLCETINAAIDYMHADKESTFEGWLDERLTELAFLDKQIKNENATRLVFRNPDAQNDSCDNTDHERVDKLISRKNALIDAIGARCRVNANTPHLFRTLNEKIPDDISLEANEEYQERHSNPNILQVSSFKNNKNAKLQLIDQFTKDRLQNKDIQIEKLIVAQTNLRKKEALAKLITKGLGFVAMTLTSIGSFGVCPPLLIAAGIIGTALSAYYIYKNANKISSYIASSFFNDKKPEQPVVNNNYRSPSSSRVSQSQQKKDDEYPVSFAV